MSFPKVQPFQVSSHQPARLVDFLAFQRHSGGTGESSPSTWTGSTIPRELTSSGWINPSAGWPIPFFSDGLDLSDIPGLYFYSPPSVWSNARLWGADLAVMEEKMEIKTHPVNKADAPKGSMEGGQAEAYAYLPTSIAAFQATNDMLTRGVSLYRASQPFEDSGRDFGAGAIIVPNNSALANELANQWGLDVFAIEEMPEGAIPMQKQKIAVYGNAEVDHCLKTLGFDYDELSRDELNAGGISGYDVFLNDDLRWSQLNADGQESFAAWFDAGGDYVGLSYRGRARSLPLTPALQT